MMRKTLYLFCLVSLQAHAGPIAAQFNIDVEEPAQESRWRKLLNRGKNLGKKVSKYIPIPGAAAVGDMLEGDLEEKVDRIEEKQDTAMDQLKRLSRKALDTKRKVEEMYYFKKSSQANAEEIAYGLKTSKPKKLMGAILEDFLGFPINPAEYIPTTEYTRDLKKNLEADLSFEKGFIHRGGYLLRDTRAALAEQELTQQDAKQFNKDYEKASAYEEEVHKALKAKRKATLKLYKQEIKRLEKEIRVLEKAKEKKGITLGDVMQIEPTIETKRSVLRELHEKLDQGIAKEMELTDAQEEKLLEKKANSDAEALDKYFYENRRRVHQKYGHLWKFW